MPRRAATPFILLVTILILTLLAAPGCGGDGPEVSVEDLPQATIEVEWEIDLTPPNDLGVMSIQQTSDGGYFIVGSTNCGYGTRGSVTGCDILLIKTDSSGSLEWAKNESREWYRFHSVLQTSDGGYMFGYGDKLRKMDSAGNEEWQKPLPRASWTDTKVLQTSDGGYIVLGTEVFWGNHGGADVWLAKMDPSGNPVWEKTLGNGFGKTIQQTFDNGFIILCTRGWLLKTDWTGKQEYDEILGHGQYDQEYGHGIPIGVIEKTEGGFMVLSRDDDGTWLTSLGSEWHPFAVVWDKGYSRKNGPVSVQRTPDRGCIVVEVGASLASLMKVDSAGQARWEATLGSFAQVTPTSDGGYAAVSYSKESETGESRVRLVKLRCTPP